MCRAIKPLYNFEPPASPEDIRAAATQYVRKISGYSHPSRSNEAAFQAAIDAIALASSRLLENLVTTTPPRSRQEVEFRAKMRSANRFQIKEK